MKEIATSFIGDLQVQYIFLIKHSIFVLLFSTISYLTEDWKDEFLLGEILFNWLLEKRNNCLESIFK